MVSSAEELPDARALVVRLRQLTTVQSDEEKTEANRKSGLAYAAAFSLFASVVSGLLVGWLLDRWLGTRPWLLVVGIVLGSVAGFYELIRTISKIS